MKNDGSVGVGVIGAGTIGKIHARIYHEMPYTQLIAVADINPQRAQALAREYDCKWYGDYVDLLKHRHIEAVSVATPDYLHRDPVITALNAGKHVLVEKPLATNLEDARAMLKAARKNARYLMVNYNNRWGFVYQKAKALIDSGQIGTPLFCYARKNDAITVPTQLLGWAKHTSCVHFLSTHDIDMIRWFLGEPEATEVYAASSEKLLHSKGIPTPDAVQAIVKFSNATIATFESGWVYPSSYPTLAESYLHIVGDKGVIQIDRREENIIIANQEGVSYPRTCLSGTIESRLEGSMRWSSEHFISSILEERPPLTSAESAIKVVEIAVAIHLSIKEGRKIKLPLKRT